MSFVDCIRCGNCCGYGRDSALGDWSYTDGEKVPEGVDVIERNGEYLLPVDNDGVCVYLIKHDNGFTSCRIHDRKPRMCALYNCLTEKKVRYLQDVVVRLKGKCE